MTEKTNKIKKLLKEIKEAKDNRRDLLKAAKKAKPTRQAMIDLEGITAEVLAIYRAEELVCMAQILQGLIDGDTEERDALLYRAGERLMEASTSAAARDRQHAKRTGS
jgi:hypothetical protein